MVIEGGSSPAANRGIVDATATAPAGFHRTGNGIAVRRAHQQAFSPSREASPVRGYESTPVEPAPAAKLAAAGGADPPGVSRSNSKEGNEVAAVSMDSFARLIEQLAEAHEQSLSQLRQENAQLRQETNSLKFRLNSVLNATWSFSGEAWNGAPKKPEEGNLTLVHETVHADAKQTEAYPVDSEDNGFAAIEAGAAFKVRTAWKDNVRKRKRRRSNQGSQSDLRSITDLNNRQKVFGQPKGRLRHFIMYPTSSFRVSWDIGSALMLSYDAVMIPMGAFTPLDSLGFVIMDWITLFYWTIDMLLSFLTGYVSQGITQMSLKLIAKNYLRSWFCVDLLIIGPEWIFSIMHYAFTSSEGGQDESDIASLIRVLRVVRVLRLLRLAKLRKLIDLIKDHIQSEAILMLADCVKLVAMLFVLNHFVGSAWYFVGTFGENFNGSWIDVDGLANKPLSFRYLTSMHWSFAHFGLGSMLIVPQNGLEYSYTIAILILGIFVFCWLVAFVTNKMMQMRDLQGETSRQMWLLRRYLRQHQVPKHLFFRILRYTEYASGTQQELIPESKVAILSLLSEQLSQELTFNVVFRRLLHHPLFAQVNETAESTLHGFVNTALSQRFLANSDFLFTSEALASHMYFMGEGRCLYSRQGQVDRMTEKDDWLSEQAIWVMWAHRGDVVVFDTQCQVISISERMVAEKVEKDLLVFPIMSRYASSFVKWLNTINYEDLTDLFGSDIGVEIVSDFMPDMETIGQPRRDSGRDSTLSRQSVASCDEAPLSPIASSEAVSGRGEPAVAWN
jgi:hypothetical protein